jgi:hypothetical protein
MLPQDARGGCEFRGGHVNPGTTVTSFRRHAAGSAGAVRCSGVSGGTRVLVETIPANRAARIHLSFPQISTTPFRRETPTPWRAARPP